MKKKLFYIGIFLHLTSGSYSLVKGSFNDDKEVSFNRNTQNPSYKKLHEDFLKKYGEKTKHIQEKLNEEINRGLDIKKDISQPSNQIQIWQPQPNYSSLMTTNTNNTFLSQSFIPNNSESYVGKDYGDELFAKYYRKEKFSRNLKVDKFKSDLSIYKKEVKNVLPYTGQDEAYGFYHFLFFDLTDRICDLELQLEKSKSRELQFISELEEEKNKLKKESEKGNFLHIKFISHIEQSNKKLKDIEFLIFDQYGLEQFVIKNQKNFLNFYVNLIEEKNLVDNKFYSLTASYRQLDDTNKNLHNQLQLIKLNLEKVESENQGSLIKLNQLNDDFNSEIQKKKLLQEDLNILREKFKDIEKENQRLTNKLYDFESKIESNKSQVKNKEIEYSDLDREKQYISEQLKSVRKELEEYKQSSKNVQDYLKELEIKDRLSEDKIDKLSTQLRQVKELYEKEKALLQEKESIIKKGIAQYEQLQLEKNWLEKKLEKSFVSPIQSTSLEKDDSEILKAELKKTSEELENQKKQNLSLELLQNQTSKDFDILKQQTELAKSTLKTVFMMLGQPQEEDDLTKLSSNLYSVIIPLLSNLKK